MSHVTPPCAHFALTSLVRIAYELARLKWTLIPLDPKLSATPTPSAKPHLCPNNSPLDSVSPSRRLHMSLLPLSSRDSRLQTHCKSIKQATSVLLLPHHHLLILRLRMARLTVYQAKGVSSLACKRICHQSPPMCSPIMHSPLRPLRRSPMHRARLFQSSIFIFLLDMQFQSRFRHNVRQPSPLESLQPQLPFRFFLLFLP